MIDSCILSSFTIDENIILDDKMKERIFKDKMLHWSCNMQEADDNSIMVRTVTERQDVVYQLFESIDHFIIFNTYHKEYTVVNIPDPENRGSRSRQIDVYSVFNKNTSGYIATLIRTIDRYSQAAKIPDICWNCFVMPIPLGTALLKLLHDKYPESRTDMFTSDPLTEHRRSRSIYDEAVYTIENNYPTSHITSGRDVELVAQLESIANAANCIFLKSDTKESKDGNISTIITTYTMYHKWADTFNNVIEIEHESVVEVDERGVPKTEFDIKLRVYKILCAEGRDIGLFIDALFNVIKAKVKW